MRKIDPLEKFKEVAPEALETVTGGIWDPQADDCKCDSCSCTGVSAGGGKAMASSNASGV